VVRRPGGTAVPAPAARCARSRRENRGTEGGTEPESKEAAVIEYIVKRDGRVVPFDKSKITFAVLRAAVAVGGRDRETAEGIADKVVALLEQRHTESYPTVEEVQDAVEKVLIEEGHAKTAKAYIVYRYEHTLKRQGRQSLTYSSENVPYKKLWETLSWAVDNDCYSIPRLRAAVAENRFKQLVDACHEFYDTELSRAEQGLRDRIDELRMVIIAGPSSSGKTTTTVKLSRALAEQGKRLVPINVDNYFFDLESHPEDPHGDYDYETPQALDMELFNEHLSELLAGRSVDIPFYNFQKGQRDGTVGSLQLEENDVILLDCLHGLYEPLTESVSQEQKYRVYIEALAQIKDDQSRFIRWADVRMLRRMVRDMQFRNHDPHKTLLHWYLVRRSELRYIVSRINNADIVMNSFMPCELPIMKRRLGHLFPDFVAELADNPDRSDAYERANRVVELFDAVPDIDAESMLPGDSLLREFIGGSTLEY
jgi:uridine kinase